MSLSPQRCGACFCRGHPCYGKTPVVWPAEPFWTSVRSRRRDPSAKQHARGRADCTDKVTP